MNRDESFPAPPGPRDPAGGMTGATGNLSPDDPEGEFIPAERREVDTPEGAGQVTAAAHRRHASRAAAEADVPGRLIERGAETGPNDRDGGYGSEHGLASRDPAYRVEEHLPPPTPSAGVSQGADAAGGEPRLGGDEIHTTEEEHF